MRSVEQHILSLIKDIEKYNYHYYVRNESLISDYTFDHLLKELEELEKKYPEYALPSSPTKRLGSDISDKFPTVEHRIPMLSLENIYEEEALLSFDKRLKKLLGTDEELPYCCELKYDGVAISIDYRDGHFFRAITRGNGKVGEDISANIKTIQTVPLILRGNDYPSRLTVRGEVFLRLSTFNAINTSLQKEGKKPFANPRNTTSGTLKTLDSKVVAQRKLSCFVYSAYTENTVLNSHYDSIIQLQKWGFNIPDYSALMIEKHIGIKNVKSFIKHWSNAKQNLDFDIDGVVIKLDNIEWQSRVGYTSKSPRWAIAYKYSTEQLQTTLLGVEYQVGRTGIVTPVAILEPILLNKTIVKRASLHNLHYIKTLDLCINDTVFVEKGGEIIPKIVAAQHTDISKEQVNFPEKCPSCGYVLKYIDDRNIFCPNDNNCKQKITESLKHFVSRKAMDIDGLGTKILQLFFEKNIIKTIPDIYKISYKDIEPIDRFREKSIQKLLMSIEDSKQKPFEKVLYAMGIRHIGEQAAEKLVEHFQNIDELLQATVEDIESIEGLGTVIAESVYQFFRTPKYQQLVKELKDIGLILKSYTTKHSAIPSIFKGKKIVISGTFTHKTREEIKHIIKQYGGINVSSISAQTTYLVLGENAGPKKLKQAATHNVTILNEEAFLEKINSNNT